MATALGLTSSDEAHAQDCPAGPWPTTRFEVIHQRTPADFEMWLTGLYTGLTRGEELAGDEEGADIAWDRLVEGYLQDIAQRLEAAGFGSSSPPASTSTSPAHPHRERTRLSPEGTDNVQQHSAWSPVDPLHRNVGPARRGFGMCGR
jgi:hypothetical protein